MSQENVEIVRATNEAWNRGDMDALRELYDPNAMCVTGLDGWPEAFEPVIGREAVMRWFEQLRDTWDADSVETISDFIDGCDRVVVRMIWRGVGHGPESAMEWTAAYTVRKGKIFLLEFFWDHAEALEAVGLSESAMSQENVEIVRAVYEAWNADDLDALLLLIHPDAELRQPDDLFLGSGTFYRGHAGVREWWNLAKEPWDYFKSHIERTLEEGDKVATVVRFEAVGKESGVNVELPFITNVFELRGGLIVRFDTYYSLEEALEAVGLSEQDAHADS